jgi:hypothetical protein
MEMVSKPTQNTWRRGKCLPDKPFLLSIQGSLQLINISMNKEEKDSYFMSPCSCNLASKRTHQWASCSGISLFTSLFRPFKCLLQLYFKEIIQTIPLEEGNFFT